MRIVFMGTPEFAVESLDAILQAGHEVAAVVTVPDRPTGRGLKVTQSAVKLYALQHQLPLLQPERLKEEGFLAALRALEAQLFVVVAFRMLPREVWAMPPLGTFNLHASLLPRYRGAAPLNWAIINGEQESGITTFLLNERIDEGAILLQERTPISPDDTVGTLHDRLARMGRSLVVRTLDGLASGTLTPQPQTGQPCPAPKIFKADCAIPWHLHGTRIRDHVRGLSPYPAATMRMLDDQGREQQLKVFDVEFKQAETDAEKSIVTDRKSYFMVAVKGGFVCIKSLQMSGKKRISVEEFLRGYDVSSWKIIE